MEVELTRQVAMLGKQIDSQVRPEVYHAAMNEFMLIPGLVGLWPMNSQQRSTGDAYDLSGQGRTLTYTGNPVYKQHDETTQYLEVDGTGDRLLRPTETDLEITATETIYDSSIRGLTMGGWFWFNDAAPAADEYLTNKHADFIFRRLSATNKLRASMTDSGATADNTDSTNTVADNEWLFLVYNFKPSSHLNIHYYDATGLTKTVNTAGILADIRAAANDFAIGARSVGGVNELAGRFSFCFLSANTLSDKDIDGLFRQSRGLFGV